MHVITELDNYVKEKHQADTYKSISRKITKKYMKFNYGPTQYIIQVKTYWPNQYIDLHRPDGSL